MKKYLFFLLGFVLSVWMAMGCNSKIASEDEDAQGLLNIGAACVKNNDCKSGLCQAGICAATGGEKGKENETCLDDSDCEGDLICSENVCSVDSEKGEDRGLLVRASVLGSNGGAIDVLKYDSLEGKYENVENAVVTVDNIPFSYNNKGYYYSWKEGFEADEGGKAEVRVKWGEYDIVGEAVFPNKVEIVSPVENSTVPVSAPLTVVWKYKKGEEPDYISVGMSCPNYVYSPDLNKTTTSYTIPAGSCEPGNRCLSVYMYKNNYTFTGKVDEESNLLTRLESVVCFKMQ